MQEILTDNRGTPLIDEYKARLEDRSSKLEELNDLALKLRRENGHLKDQLEAEMECEQCAIYQQELDHKEEKVLNLTEEVEKLRLDTTCAESKITSKQRRIDSLSSSIEELSEIYQS